MSNDIKEIRSITPNFFNIEIIVSKINTKCRAKSHCRKMSAFISSSFSVR